MRRQWRLWVGLCAAIAALGASPPQSRAACDRRCLEAFVDRYFVALLAHDPSRLPFAKGVRFTENGQRLELGDGLWRLAAGKGTYRLFVTDVDAGQVAVIHTLREETRTPNESVGAVMALRMRVAAGLVTEVETFVVRNPQAAQNLEKLGAPHPLWIAEVPAAERASRSDLVKTSNMYFSGMELNDGKGEYPFADDCERFENGSQSTNLPTPPGQARPDPATAPSYSAQWSCREQFASGLLRFVTRIRDRRFVAVDVERGLVFSFVFFDHAAGATRTYQTPNGRTVTNGPPSPFTWELAELFRIEHGRIRRIEAILASAPYGMLSGWSSWEDGMSSRAQDVTSVGGRGR